ncbi:ornithine cyclodeaminase family protein [Haloferula sp. A504]|uniref:ornithine cyclodeaminase family protein n=1 Tax=Haloferula sp. A504 TaxID=3373601 RepID=UPI0031C1BB86|nr:ornithine cyclodeaminase family protein [Verrucomicrobiaceae bacterium E54]
MKIITADQVHAALSYPALIDALGEAYAGEFKMPPRQVFLLDDDDSNHDAFAVLPSWGQEFIGVKAFTYFPENEAPHKSIYAQILLFKRDHGEPLALVDGTTVTLWRTAGISGLATRLLSRENSETMLLLGTGNLAPYLIRANASVRNLKKVLVWGRNAEKAAAVCEAAKAEHPGIDFVVADDRQSACGEADIIVSATGSHEPLVLGDWVKPGTHTDFIGNHHATKRECDTELITKAKVYCDTYVNAMKEAGEILVPISEGVFTKEDIVSDLVGMCNGSATLRQSDDEITLFKSIGMALSDLVGAGLAYKASE